MVGELTPQQERWLEVVSDRIEAILTARRIDACVGGGMVTASTITFEIACAVGTKVSKVAESASRFAEAAGVGECRVFRSGAVIYAQLPRPKSKRQALQAPQGDVLEMWQIEQFARIHRLHLVEHREQAGLFGFKAMDGELVGTARAEVGFLCN